MIRSTLRACGLLLGLAVTMLSAPAQPAVQAAASAPVAAPVEAYAQLPGARGARLSPSGQRLALIAPVQGRMAIVVWDLDGKGKPVVIKTGEGEPSWVAWKSDQRLVVSLRVVSDRGVLVKTVDTRLIAVDADGSRVTELVQADKGDYTPQIQDRVLSFLEDDPGHILLELPKVDRMSRTPASASTIHDRVGHPEVVKVDLRTGATETVVPMNGQINTWISDRSGAVRLGWSLSRDKKSLELLYRDQPQHTWRSVQTLTLNQGQTFEPLAFLEGQSDHIYVSSNHAVGWRGIYEYSLSEKRFVRTVAEDPAGDLDAIVRGDEMVAIEGGRSRLRYLSKDWGDDARLIDKALPDSLNVLVDRSRDGHRVLLSVLRGNEPVDFWLLTRSAAQPVLEPVTEAYPGLNPSQIAPTTVVSYSARDGLKIPALLTLPVGARRGPGAVPLPFVVLPHGGPSAHDSRGFDYWVQFLASRGYGVLQPQFRGSTGYGPQFLTAGYGQWGLAMQDDVTDGTRWLIDQKLADPRRIALVGGSYGGYAALMGLIKEPVLYRAAVAFAAVTDLLTLVDDQRGYVFGDLNLPQIVKGSGATLEETSPAQQATRIIQPVLLLHGRKDYTVPVLHTELMERALKRAGKPVQAIYLDEADHYLSRAEDRLTLLKALEAFLAAQLK